MGRIFKASEIYWVHFEGKNHIQNGIRPAIIVQNNKGNYYSDTIVVIPITSAAKTTLPTHVKIKAGEFGLTKNSIAQCEGIRVVNKSDIGDYIGTADRRTMKKIAVGCLINIPLLNFLGSEDNVIINRIEAA